MFTPIWFYLYLYFDSKNTTYRNRDQKSNTSDIEEVQVHLKNDHQYDNEDPIKFNHLTKRFGDLIAVNKLQFSIKKGEIFTFLGHNGAGKTTAMNMLAGILPPTDGDVIVYDNSIKKEVDKVQINLGLCQQTDVLFDDMTVYEHLYFVCELKDCDPE